MSTRTTKALVEKDGLYVHLYQEMLDQLCHLEIDWDEGNQPSINVVIPNNMVPILTKILEKANV